MNKGIYLRRKRYCVNIDNDKKSSYQQAIEMASHMLDFDPELKHLVLYLEGNPDQYFEPGKQCENLVLQRRNTTNINCNQVNPDPYFWDELAEELTFENPEIIELLSDFLPEQQRIFDYEKKKSGKNHFTVSADRVAIVCGLYGYDLNELEKDERIKVIIQVHETASSSSWNNLYSVKYICAPQGLAELNKINPIVKIALTELNNSVNAEDRLGYKDLKLARTYVLGMKMADSLDVYRPIFEYLTENLWWNPFAADQIIRMMVTLAENQKLDGGNIEEAKYRYGDWVMLYEKEQKAQK